MLLIDVEGQVKYVKLTLKVSLNFGNGSWGTLPFGADRLSHWVPCGCGDL